MAREFLSESESARLFAQLIDGNNRTYNLRPDFSLDYSLLVAVTYLHVNGIIHRDLKLENILLDRFRNLKLTDFGFANVVADNTERMLRTSCGSPCYAAPELVVNNVRFFFWLLFIIISSNIPQLFSYRSMLENWLIFGVVE